MAVQGAITTWYPWREKDAASMGTTCVVNQRAMSPALEGWLLQIIVQGRADGRELQSVWRPRSLSAL